VADRMIHDSSEAMGKSELPAIKSITGRFYTLLIFNNFSLSSIELDTLRTWLRS